MFKYFNIGGLIDPLDLGRDPATVGWDLNVTLDLGRDPRFGSR